MILNCVSIPYLLILLVPFLLFMIVLHFSFMKVFQDLKRHQANGKCFGFVHQSKKNPVGQILLSIKEVCKVEHRNNDQQFFLKIPDRKIPWYWKSATPPPFYHIYYFSWIFYFDVFIARSPFEAHLESTLEGVSTIRAFQITDTVIHEFHGCTDYQTEGQLMYIYSMNWFVQRINFIVVIISICCIFAPVILARFIGKFVNSYTIFISRNVYQLRIIGLYISYPSHNILINETWC